MIKAEVLQNNVILIKDNVVADSVKFETVEFKFPKSWDFFSKTAVFYKADGEAINVILSEDNPLCLSEDECYIPHEVMNSPGFYISVFGILGDSVATATKAYIKVLESGFAEGAEPESPTESEYQQLINLSEETRKLAQSVRDDADNGLFKGEKGDQGEPGLIGPQGEKGEKGDQGDTGATGPRGFRGYTGEQGPQGDKGDKGDIGPAGPKGDKGDRGEQGIQGEKGDKGDRGEDGEVTYSYVHTNSANAYKTTKEGEIIIADDISPLEHELKVCLKSDSVTDFSAVKVSRYGKNLFPIDKDNLLDSIGNYTFDSEGVYGNYGSGASNYVMFSAKYPVGTYSFSAKFSSDLENSNQGRIIIRCFDADENLLTSGLSNYNDFYKAFIRDIDGSTTFTIPDTAAYWCIGWVPKGEMTYAVSSMKFPQLELGDSTTSYESCKRQIVTANADGVVEGLTSAAPIMILTTDNEDVIIECEYNKDINTLLDEDGVLSGYCAKKEMKKELEQYPTNADIEEVLSDYYTKEETDNALEKIPLVDQTYNPKSKNPQSGIAVAEALNNIRDGSIEFWQPNTEYKVGDVLIGYASSEYNGHIASFILMVNQDHTSPEWTDADFDTLSSYGELHPINAHVANSAYMDGSGNIIDQIYVTKEELAYLLDDIETALDGIISIQNSFIGGDSV